MPHYKIRAKLNPHQHEFDQDLETWILALCGGMGSGKSFALCQKMLKLSMLNRGWPGGLLAPTLREIKRDIIPLMEGILEEARIPVQYNKTDQFFRFPWTRGKLYLFSAENKIRGPNLGYAGINEFTLMPKVRVQEMIARVRLRQARHKQIALVGTPEGIGHWGYEWLVENPIANSRIIYGSTRDNAANIGENYIAMLEASFDKTMLDAYEKGLWVNMTGSRFYYGYDPVRNDDRTLERLDGERVIVSLDFNVDPMIATCWHDHGSWVGAFDQVVLEGGQGFKTENMIAALKARNYTPNNTTIYPDPAGRARSTKGDPDIVILERAGYHVVAKSKAPLMRERQLNMNNLFDKGIIKLHPEKCSKLKKDLLAVEADPVTLEKKKDNPALTHASDGADYFCDIKFPFSGRKPAQTTEIRIR